MLKYIAPPKSRRRFFLRALRESLIAPKTFFNRFNFKNFKTFLNLSFQKIICSTCGENATMFYDFPDLALRKSHSIYYLRETLQCSNCLSSMRHRALSLKLVDEINKTTGSNFQSIKDISKYDFGKLKILDSDVYSMLSHLMIDNPAYFSGVYDQTAQEKFTSKRVMYLNLEQTNLEEAQFDYVLTSDVMEHVRNIDKAHKEIHRILKIGGKYIFTVPYDQDLVKNRILVETKGEKDIFLENPHYHGDPLNKERGVLSYRIFGSEIFKDLKTLGFEVKFYDINKVENGIINGDVFVATKQK